MLENPIVATDMPNPHDAPGISHRRGSDSSYVVRICIMPDSTFEADRLPRLAYIVSTVRRADEEVKPVLGHQGRLRVLQAACALVFDSNSSYRFQDMQLGDSCVCELRAAREYDSALLVSRHACSMGGCYVLFWRNELSQDRGSRVDGEACNEHGWPAGSLVSTYFAFASENKKTNLVPMWIGPKPVF